MRPVNLYHRKVVDWLSELGVSYMEEYPVGQWSLDIYLSEMNLGVEIDGPHHRPGRDRIRDRKILVEHEIKVVRIKVGTAKEDALHAIFGEDWSVPVGVRTKLPSGDTDSAGAAVALPEPEREQDEPRPRRLPDR